MKAKFKSNTCMTPFKVYWTRLITPVTRTHNVIRANVIRIKVVDKMIPEVAIQIMFNGVK